MDNQHPQRSALKALGRLYGLGRLGIYADSATPSPEAYEKQRAARKKASKQRKLNKRKGK